MTMQRVQKAATGVALAASLTSLAGTVYVYKTMFGPNSFRPAVSQPAPNEPINYPYLGRVAAHQGFDFRDSKTGNSAHAYSFRGLSFYTSTDDGIKMRYDSTQYSLSELQSVTVTNPDGDNITIREDKIEGAHGGALGDTTPEKWKEFEADYTRLAEEAFATARMVFSDKPEREKSLVDRVNQR